MSIKQAFKPSTCLRRKREIIPKFSVSLHRNPRERSPSVAPASLGKHLAIGLETLQMFTS